MPVTIHSARGVIIGKKGADIEKLKQRVGKMTDSEVVLNIVEVRKPEIDGNWLPKASRNGERVGFRRAMKRAVQSAMRLGAWAFVLIAVAVSANTEYPYRMVSRGPCAAAHAARRY